MNTVQLQKPQEISVKARVIQRDQFPSDVVEATVFFCSGHCTVNVDEPLG